MLRPPFPATRNFRPTEGLASYSVTRNPANAATSAARKPAGPPPITATEGFGGDTMGFIMNRT